MKFLLLTLIGHHPDTVTGEKKSPADGVTIGQKRRSLELFQSDVAPALRERIPSRPLADSSTVKEIAL